MTRLRGRDIGMIFQEPMTALNPMKKTIGDQVAETLLVHRAVSGPRPGQTRRPSPPRNSRVGLPTDRFPLSLYPHELSGGQRRRSPSPWPIALRPRLLIADEPTTALDVTTQAQILDLLRGLAADDLALLLITDLAVVADMARQLAVMQGGRIVEDGGDGTAVPRPRQDYTRRLLQAAEHRPARRPPARSTDSSAPLLSVEGAVRDYILPRPSAFAPHPLLRAVDRVSFSIRPGESLGLVGESGCGKSTLTRAILGLDPLQGGAIRLGQAPVTAGRTMPAALRARMQVVFQDPYGSFNPRHRVSRLVAEPFHLTGRPPDADRRIAAALEEVGLSAADRHKYIHEFSGGQRQRVAIARSLIIRPDLIVLDEAVSALDVRVRAQVLDLLARLQESHGLAYLFISHDLRVVRALSHKIIVMRQGDIVESGTGDKIFERPQTDYTRELMAAAFGG